MKTYTLTRKQVLRASIEEVWDFFSSPENLDEITPDDMGFKITSPQPLAKMHEGQIIEYKVSPILNIPLNWKTKIIEVEEKNYFTDLQLNGPYKLWRHKHVFEDRGDHVIMSDYLEYALPMGWLGRLANQIFVRKRIEEIFDYRLHKVDALFNKASEGVDNFGESLAVQ